MARKTSKKVTRENDKVEEEILIKEAKKYLDKLFSSYVEKPKTNKRNIKLDPDVVKKNVELSKIYAETQNKNYIKNLRDSSGDIKNSEIANFDNEVMESLLGQIEEQIDKIDKAQKIGDFIDAIMAEKMSITITLTGLVKILSKFNLSRVDTYYDRPKTPINLIAEWLQVDLWKLNTSHEDLMLILSDPLIIEYMDRDIIDYGSDNIELNAYKIIPPDVADIVRGTLGLTLNKLRHVNLFGFVEINDEDTLTIHFTNNIFRILYKMRCRDV